MKKMLSYVGLLLLAGVIFGAIVTGLVWMQHLYDLSVSYYLFTAAFWLGMAATVLFGIWLRRYYPQLSKNWVFFAVLTALFGVYLFPIFLAPTCSEIPTVKAGCETTCVQVCIHYHEAGTGGCPEIPDLPNPDWDVGCCFDYAPSCTTVCTNDPPSVTGHTECDVFGNDGWCVEGGELYMSGSDPDGDHITISGTMVGQSFSCPQGTSCVRTLYEGSGNAVFHSYDGELSSGNFSIAYKYDATPPTLTPTVTGTAGTNSWYISPISVATGATDPASGVMISKIRLFTGDWQDSLDFDVDGIYYVEMSALDNAGNESVQQAQIMLDTTNPVYDVVVSGTAGVSDWYRSDVNWQASATDATSGMASIEVIMDASAWNIGDTAAFSAEGPHTVDFRFTDIAGNSVETNHTFSIDKTAPTIVIDNPTEGKVVNRTVMVSGNAADNLSGLVEVAVSPDGGATWHMIPWETDGSWIYDWDTTQGPNGVFALIARTTDVAGNVTTDQVNVIVDNAPPTVTLTESWEIWETARAAVFSNIIPIGSISITVDCDEQPDRVIEYNANEGAFDFKWDHRCGDGNLAPSGSYTVVLEACDIYHNCDDARGTVDIPFVALQIAPPTATPMPTAEKTEAVKQWYTNPTAIPSNTPTPKAEQNLPVLPLTGGNDSGDSNTPSGNNQPLLPLAAAALGTSVLLAASSRKEEETANETKISEIPYVKVTSLSTLAGVVKETFEGVWEDAIRISAADPRRVTVYKTGIDLDEYNRKLASWVAEIEYKQTDEYKRTVASYQEEMTISAKVHEKILGNESVNYDDYAEYMRLISSTGGRALTDLTNQQLIDFALPDDIPNEAAIKAIRTYLTTKEVAEERAKADAIAAATATALNKKMERDEIKITQNIGPKTKEEKKIWDKFIRDESLTSEQNNVQKTETEQKKTLWGIISGIWSGASSSAIEAVRSSTPTLSPTITPTNTPSSTPTVTFTPTVTNTPTVTPTVTRVAEIKTPYPGKYEITYFTELPFKYPGGSLASYLAGSTDGTRGVACYYGPGPNDTYWAEVTAKANLKNTGGYHSGIDFSLPLGTPLYWTGDQDAIWVGQDLRFGAGPTNFVVKTENEFALYGHSIPLTNKDLQIEYRCRDGSILGIDDNCNINPNIPNSRNPELTYIGDEEYYSDGTVIHPGDLIGYSGENDAGVAHLHWEIRPIIDGKSLTTGCYINPLSRFDPKLFNDWYDLIKEDYFDPNTPLDGYYEVYDNCPEVEE